MRHIRVFIFVSSLSFLSACSIHPLPEDVARLTTVQIVQQIRCEARSALIKNGFPADYIPPDEETIEKEAEKAKKTAELKNIFDYIQDAKSKNIQILNNDAFLQTRYISKIQTSDEFKKLTADQLHIHETACELTDLYKCDQSKDVEFLNRSSPVTVVRSKGVASEKKRTLREKINKFIQEKYTDSQCISSEYESMDNRIADVANFIADRKNVIQSNLQLELNNSKQKLSAQAALLMKEAIDLESQGRSLQSKIKRLEAEGKQIAAANAPSVVPEKQIIDEINKEISLDYVTAARDSINKELDCFRYKNRFYQNFDESLEEFMHLAPSYRPQKYRSVLRQQEADELKLGLTLCNFDDHPPRCRGGLKPSSFKISDKEKKAQRAKFAKESILVGFKDVAIGYDFDFQITDKDKENVGLDFSLPFSNGSFSLGSTFSEAKTRFNTRKFTLAENVEQLLADTRHCEVSEVDWKYPLSGEIGMQEVAKTYLGLRNISGFGKSSDAKAQGSKEGYFTEKLQFTTEIIGSLTPTLSLNTVPNAFRLAKATAGIEGTRKDVHQVTVTFVEVEKPKEEVNVSEIFPSSTLPKELTGPSATGVVSCSGNKCSLEGTGIQLNYIPPTENFQGTIQCDAENCSIQSELPLGLSATDKALEILEKRRSEESIRDVIREELADQ